MEPPRHRLEQLAIVGGFLDGQRFTFDQGLNTVIGARGTGKTTVLELVRYAFDCLPADGPGRRRVEDLVARNLRGGRVDLHVCTRDGLRYVVSRAPGEEPIITTADGTVTELSVGGGGLFRLDVFSQNEVETIADRSADQLELLDTFEAAEVGALSRQIDEVRQALQLNATRLKPLRTQAGDLAEDLRGLPGVEERLRAFQDEAGDDGDAINAGHAQKALRDREQRALERAKRLVDELGRGTRELIGRVETGAGDLGLDEFAEGPNAGLVAALGAELDGAGQAVSEGLQGAVDRLREAWGRVAEIEAELGLRHKEQEVAFQQLLEQHKEAQGKASERARLERLRNELLGKQRDLAAVTEQIAELEGLRQAQLDRLSELRDQRFGVRKAIAERINAAVAPSVRVTIAQCGSTDAYRGLIEQALRGSGVRQGQVAEKLAGSIAPQELAAIVQQQDREALRERAGLNDNQAQKLLEALGGEDRLAELETVELADRPTIELNDNGTWKPTLELSTGQKCTAILPLLLLDSDHPLLIDQPEDNLDNRFVYEAIVEGIRRVKAGRQLIFVTHNPNIPVLGEAEQVFVMESDGLAGRLKTAGDVDHCKGEIVTLLEGGEDAFRRRGDRYACGVAS